MEKLRNYYVTIIVIAAVILLNIAAFTLYIINVNKDIEEQTEEYLAQIMEEASACVEMKVEETIHELDMTAYSIGMEADYTSEDVLNKIGKMTKKAGFSKFDIINAAGIGLAQNGSVDYSEKKFFRKVMEGDLNIEDVRNEEGIISGIRFSMPIETEEGVAGVYLVECSLDEFSDFLGLDSVSSKGKPFIIKQDGTVLSREEKSSIQDISDILNNERNEKTLKSYMKSKKAGILGFENETGGTRYICYSSTDYNDWEIIMVVSSKSVKANISDVTDNVIFLGVVLGATLILISGYFIFHLIVAKSENAINLHRYYMVSKYTEDIIFDYSCKKDTLYCNENWKKVFGYELPKEQVKENMFRYIAAEDRELCHEKMDQVQNTKDDLVQFKCHILNHKQEKIPCICKLFGVKNSRGKVLKIVGVLEKNV